MTSPPSRRIARPIGVSILSLFDALVLGLLPLVVLLILDHDPAIELSRLDYFVTAGLAIIIVGASLGTFFGENIARLILLGAIAVSSMLMILSNLSLLASDSDTKPESLTLVRNILHGLFWIGINWWYLNRKGTLEYYQQQQKG